MKIEFLYFEGCPNHKKTYELLQTILKEQTIEADPERIEIKDDENAVRHQFVGSPTIRVNGIDVDPVQNNSTYAKTCRVYTIDGKLTGLPSRSMIEDALLVAETAKNKRRCC